jgi:hypothetical protein
MEGIPNTLRVYGYDFINNALIINPAESEVVRMIYNDYLNGMGKNAIVRKLIHNKVPTKNGRQWCENAVYKILCNQKYTGNMLLQKVFTENHLTKVKKENKGELPMYYVENSHEAIIDSYTFEAVQREIANRAKKYEKGAKQFSWSEFSGTIHCDKCGANFQRRVIGSGIKSKAVWICATFKTRGKKFCSSKRIPEDILKETAASVLGIPRYDTKMLVTYVKEIKVPENGVLIFVFKNNNEIIKTWKNKSRSESWDEEMRNTAGEKRRKGVKNINGFNFDS